MQIRPLSIADLDLIDEIDATIESSHYLHVDRVAEGLSARFEIESRPLAERSRQSNPIDDDLRFSLKQVAGENDEGLAVVGEHDGVPIALVLATASTTEPGLVELRDVRVDFDRRREGLGSMLLFQAINFARDKDARAIRAQARTSNAAFNHLLAKLGFEIAGLDTFRGTNHDLVKEETTLLWYLPLR